MGTTLWCWFELQTGFDLFGNITNLFTDSCCCYNNTKTDNNNLAISSRFEWLHFRSKFYSMSILDCSYVVISNLEDQQFHQLNGLYRNVGNITWVKEQNGLFLDEFWVIVPKGGSKSLWRQREATKLVPVCRHRSAISGKFHVEMISKATSHKYHAKVCILILFTWKQSLLTATKLPTQHPTVSPTSFPAFMPTFLPSITQTDVPTKAPTFNGSTFAFMFVNLLLFVW